MKTDYNPKLAAMHLLLVQGRRIRRTALYKLLFLADVVHVLKFGWTISGSNYLKLQYGPVAEDGGVTRSTLVRVGFIQEERQSHLGSYHFWYRVDEARVDLDLVRRDLPGDELDVLDRVRQRLAAKPASYLSEKNRQFEPWISTRAAEVLDISKVHHDRRLIAWVKRMKLI